MLPQTGRVSLNISIGHLPPPSGNCISCFSCDLVYTLVLLVRISQVAAVILYRQFASLFFREQSRSSRIGLAENSMSLPIRQCAYHGIVSEHLGPSCHAKLKEAFSDLKNCLNVFKRTTF